MLPGEGDPGQKRSFPNGQRGNHNARRQFDYHSAGRKKKGPLRGAKLIRHKEFPLSRDSARSARTRLSSKEERLKKGAPGGKEKRKVMRCEKKVRSRDQQNNAP